MSSYVPAWVKTNPERFPRAEVDGRPPRRGAVGVRARQRPGGRARVHRADALPALRRRPRPHRDHGAGRERGRDDRRGRRPQRRRRRRRSRAPVPKELLARFPGKKPRAPGSRCSAAGRRRRSCSWRGTTPATSTRSRAPARPRTRCRCSRTRRSTGPGKQPGQYPSGGPLPHLFDAWKAGAPSLDLLAPDIYLPDFVTWCDATSGPATRCSFPRRGTTRTPRSTRCTRSAAARSVSRRSRSSPTADAAAAALTKAYVDADRARRRCSPPPAPGKTAGVLFDKEHPTATLRFGDLALTVVARLHVRVGVARAPRSDLAARAAASSSRSRPTSSSSRATASSSRSRRRPGVDRRHRARRRGPRRERQVRRHAPAERRRDPPGPPPAPADGRARRPAREALPFK